MGDCFLHIRREANGFRIEGAAVGLLGHKISRPGDSGTDGIFVEWSWDGSRLEIRNDRYGFYPLYYFANSDEIAISTSILRLLEAGAPRAFDDAGLAAFLRLGYFLGEDTPFRAIRALPPAAILEWRSGDLTVSGRISIGKPDTLSRDAAIDGFISLFRAAIQRRQPSTPNVVLPLSGGRDSRHILLELCRQGMRPDICVTAHGFPKAYFDNEAEIASLLCKSLGLPHLALDQPESMTQAELEKNLRTGLCSLEHGWYLVVADHLNRTAGAVYDGICGDVFSAAVFLSKKHVEMCEEGRVTELADDWFSVIPDRAIKSALNPDLARRLNQELALSRLETEFRRHVEAPDPISSFHFWNRTRRMIALCPYGLVCDVPEVFCPYIDHELFDFFASLPARMLVDQNLHNETIERAFPEYAKFPYVERKSAGEAYRKHFRFHALAAMRLLLRSRSHPLLRNSYFIPRLTRCLVDPSYLPSAEWVGTFALFMGQLETVVQN